MSEPEFGVSAARAALHEAAALETARIYGQVCPEHRNEPAVHGSTVTPVCHSPIDLAAARQRRRKSA